MIFILVTIIWVLIPSLQNNDKVMSIYLYNQQILTEISKIQLTTCILEDELKYSPFLNLIYRGYSSQYRYINTGFSTFEANKIEVDYLIPTQSYIVEAMKLTQYDLSSLKDKQNALDFFHTIIPVHHQKINTQTSYTDYVMQMGIQLQNLAAGYENMSLTDETYIYLSDNSKGETLTSAYKRLQLFNVRYLDFLSFLGSQKINL